MVTSVKIANDLNLPQRATLAALGHVALHVRDADSRVVHRDDETQPALALLGLIGDGLPQTAVDLYRGSPRVVTDRGFAVLEALRHLPEHDIDAGGWVCCGGNDGFHVPVCRYKDCG